MCPRQKRINHWPAARPQLRHILAILVLGPQAGSCWLLPWAAPRCRSGGSTSPQCCWHRQSPQVPPAALLPPERGEQHPRSPPPEHRSISGPNPAEQIRKAKHRELLSQSVGCRRGARCQRHHALGGQCGGRRGLRLPELLPAAAQPSPAPQRSQLPAAAALASVDGATVRRTGQ